MYLWFIGLNTRIIGEPVDEKEAMKMINDFCQERAFKIYYYRMWNDNGNTWYDVGSHSEFFCLTGSQENPERRNF